MFKIAICDDDTKELDYLKKLIHEYQEKSGIYFEIYSFNNGFSFLETLKNSYDICFLDIFMPNITGMDVAKEIRKIDREIELVFTTSSIEFAVSGYQVRASNYLVKPIGQKQFFNALDDIVQRIKLKQSVCICINTEVGINRIPIKSIAIVEANKNSSIITLRNKEKIFSNMKFGKICEILSNEIYFYVVSRSVIVNFHTILGTENDMLLVETGDKIVMPRRKKQEITTAFLNFNTIKLE